jgi:hypothetical protein
MSKKYTEIHNFTQHHVCVYIYQYYKESMVPDSWMLVNSPNGVQTICSTGFIFCFGDIVPPWVLSASAFFQVHLCKQSIINQIRKMLWSHCLHHCFHVHLHSPFSPWAIVSIVTKIERSYEVCCLPSMYDWYGRPMISLSHMPDYTWPLRT